MTTARPTAIKVVTWPAPFKDADEVLRNLGGEGFEKAIDAAKPAALWMIDSLDSVYERDLSEPEGRDGAVEDLVETLAVLRPFERTVRVQQLADKLDASEFEVRRALNEAYLARHGRKMVDPDPVGMDIPTLDA